MSEHLRVALPPFGTRVTSYFINHIRVLLNSLGRLFASPLSSLMTIAVIGMVVGLSHVAMAVNQELTDVAAAIGALNQSYSFTGYKCCECSANKPSSSTPGSSFTDTKDICDGGSCTDVATCSATVEDNH